MALVSSTAVPPGFTPHSRKSPVTAPWEPIFARELTDAFQLGFVLAPAHCNSRGFLHGGVIATLADNAMGLSLGTALAARGERPAGGAVTTHLGVDYLGTAELGQWILIAPRVVKSGRSSGVVDALVTADGKPIARADATFRVLG
jgi:uncharacterized protein (TIGR00369 family)